MADLGTAADAQVSTAPEEEGLLQAAFSLLSRLLFSKQVAVTVPAPHLSASTGPLPTSLFGYQPWAGSIEPQPAPLAELARAAASSSCSLRCREALKATVTWPWPSQPPPSSAAAPSFFGAAQAAWRLASRHPQGLLLQVDSRPAFPPQPHGFYFNLTSNDSFLPDDKYADFSFKGDKRKCLLANKTPGWPVRAGTRLLACPIHGPSQLIPNPCTKLLGRSAKCARARLNTNRVVLECGHRSRVAHTPTRPHHRSILRISW